MPEIYSTQEHEKRGLLGRHRAPVAPEPQRVYVTNLRTLVIFSAIAYLMFRFFDAIAITLLLLGLAFFIALVLEPPVRWLDKHGLKRGYAVAAIAILFLSVLALAGYLFLPPLYHQIEFYIQNGPRYLNMLQQRAEELVARFPALRNQLENTDVNQIVSQYAQRLLPQIGQYSLNLISGLFSALFVFIIALYSVASPGPLVKGVVGVLPREHRRVGLRVLSRVITMLQAWVRATLVLMVLVGVVSGVLLYFAGVPNAFLFGVIAGIGEGIPTVGPILSAIPPILAVIGDDPQKAMVVVGIFTLVQQLENNLLVPRVMAQSLDLHPVSVMFWVIAATALFGPLGALLATPICVVVKVVYQEVYRRRIQHEPIERPEQEAEQS